MKLKEALEQIPEEQRSAVIAEAQKATSADDLAAIAARYNLDIDAQAVYDKLCEVEVDEEDLKKVAGGNFWTSCHVVCA